MNKKRKGVNSKVLMQQKQRRRQMITFGRIIKYGMSSFGRNAWLSVASTAIMTITLLIIFSSLAARTVMMDTVDDIRDKIDISVYISRDAELADVRVMQESIGNLESVREIEYTSPEETRDNFAANNASDADIRAALIEAQDEFFGVFNVKLVDVSETDELQEFVDSDPVVQENLDPDHPPTYASSRREAIDSIANSIRFAESVGLLAGGLFTIIASLIIFNTIRMAIFNRREEIYMMKLIGANKNFIRGPFIVEAIFCGVIASFLATAVGYGVLSLIQAPLESAGVIVSPLIDLLNRNIILVVLAMMGIGSVIGMFSSLAATKKHLKI